MMNPPADFLKEMGITQWAPRDVDQSNVQEVHTASPSVVAEDDRALQSSLNGTWWFIGSAPRGDAQLLFQNMIRALGLSKHEWVWKDPSNKSNLLATADYPVVAVAFGESVAQKMTGERDPLPLLRETVLALNTGGEEEIPVVASFEFNHLLSQPKDKALLWQDLMLARSVLQNS